MGKEFKFPIYVQLTYWTQMKAFGNPKHNLYQLVLIDISEHEGCLLHKLSKHGCVMKNIRHTTSTSHLTQVYPIPIFFMKLGRHQEENTGISMFNVFPRKIPNSLSVFWDNLYIYIYKYIISLMFINICISRNFQALVFFSVTLLFWKKISLSKHVHKKTHFPHSKMDHWLILEPWKTNPRPALGARRRSRSRFRVRMDFLRRQGDRIGKVDQWQTTHRKVNQLRHGGFFRTPLREGC